MKRIDFRRQLDIMTEKEFLSFCVIMHIDLNQFFERKTHLLKKEVGDLLNNTYHKLRFNQADFKRFDSLVTKAILNSTLKE